MHIWEGADVGRRVGHSETHLGAFQALESLTPRRIAMAGEASSGHAPESAPLLHGESPSERVRFAPSGVTPFGNGDVSGRGARLAAIGALACCGAVAAYASSSSAPFSGMVALGAGRRRARDASPVTSAHAARRAAALGRSNNRVLLSPSHHLAYCNVPKAASSTVTTYMTGLNAGINTFKGVEEYIQANGGDSHFAMTQYSTFDDAALASQLEPDGEKYKVFTVVRHPGTRLYSTWFDKIHAHRGSDQPDLLWYACNNDEECPFEKFVEGVTNQIADVGDTKQFINEHVEPQADICNPKKRDFDGVFRLEDGFGEIADTLRDWTGTAFDFQSEEGETGYSHHNSQSKEVYSEFPVSDVEGYESLMPYAVQLKIYEAYRQDFDLFGYRAPAKRDTQLDSCPKIKWSEELLESEWSGEDAKHLHELEAQGLLNPDVDNGKLPPREELAKPRTPGQEEGSFESAEGARENEPAQAQQQPKQQQQQQQQQQQGKPVPTAFGGNEFLADDYGDAGGASSNANANQKEVKRAPGNMVPEEAAKEVAAKKAVAAEAQMQRTTVEQREWEAEVEEARRLHEDEGLSAADAVSKAHSEAVWLKEQKRKLEHAQKMMELDQKWGAAKQKEAKRLVEQEKMSWADAEAKAKGEARWLRQKEEEKILLAEQMSEAEAEKRHALAISASEQEMVKAGAVSSDAAATLATGDAFADGAVPLEMQKAVGMGEFDAFAGDYSDVDASIPGLKPDVETEAKAERKAKAEKQAVQAQWRAKDADVRDVQAEYVKWMRANGKKAPARAARKKRPDASPAAKALSGNALAEAEQDKKKAQGEFERWKKENNVAGNGDEGDAGDASVSGSAEASADYGAVAAPAKNAVVTFGTDGAQSSDSVPGGANGGGVPLVDPEEVAEAEARAAQKKDLELSSREDADKLERFEAWKKENEKLDYDEDVVNPVPISEDGRIMTPEQAEEEAKAALEEEQMSDEYKQWAATNLRPRNAEGEAKAAYASARSSSSLGAGSVSKNAQRGFASARGALGDVVLDDLAIFDAPEGHRLDFMRELEPFLAMRDRVRANHDALAEELDAIRVATPDVYALIQENMGEFKAFMTEGLDPVEMQSGKGAPLPTAEEVFGYLGGMDQRRTAS